MGFTPDPMFQLSQAKTAVIKQQVELFELITGCETQNRYHVYIITHTENLFIFLSVKSYQLVVKEPGARK
jgi:hypothetical protein